MAEISACVAARKITIRMRHTGLMVVRNMMSILAFSGAAYEKQLTFVRLSV